jgi:signal transduction histidine kinase
MRARIFEPFVQLGATDPAAARARHGLAFCRLAVEAHDGTIRAEDANPGALFVLRIPDAR